MNYAETEGSSIDDAIERALMQLGVTRDKVEIEIISNSTKGIFGFGGRPAKVRATLRAPLEPGSPKRSEVSNRGSETQDPGRNARPMPRPAPGSDRPSSANRPEAAKAPAAKASAAKPPAAKIDGATLERARKVLQEVIHLMGSEGEVQAGFDAEDGALLQITGDATGVLIGRRGQTLDALEYLANRVIARDDENAGRILVDSQNYRQRRRQALEDLAQRLAERARRRGKTVTLNPMSPRDRRIVHMALQNDRSLTTRSSGNGYFRRLLIIPASERPPRGERPQRRPPSR